MKTLIKRAEEAAALAYAPYSKFRVGAAVQSSSGEIFLGANVENASYGLSLCAERVALSAAVTAGQTDIKAIAIACIDAKAGAPFSQRCPCGACRQWIHELAPNAEIFIKGENKPFKIDDLLPHPFDLK